MSISRQAVSVRQAGVAVATAVLAVWILALPGMLSDASALERLGWIVLDLTELSALLAFLYAALNRLPWVGLVARAAAVLFLLDAVVDLATSGAELPTALAMAVFAELPVAWLCLSEAGRLQSSPVHQFA